MDGVYSCRVQMRMVVDGREFEIVQFSADWAKDAIPKCSVLVAVGRNAQDGNTPAQVHKNAEVFRKMSKAFVYFRAEGEYSEGVEWPDGEFLAFEGLIEGTALAKVNGALHYVVHIVHWLALLDFASSLCQQSHVANPIEYTYQAVVSPLTQRAGAFPRASGLSLLAEGDVINANDLKTDLWGRALKPFLVGLAKQRGIIKRAAFTECGEVTADNKEALDALTRIESSDLELGLGLSCHTPRLSLRGGADGSIPPAVGRRITDAIRGEAVESFTNITLWGKLVGAYASSFMFSIIPMIDRAIVVPFIPGLRDTYCKTITAREYSSVNLTGTLQHPLKAVGVFDNVQYTNGSMEPGISPHLVGIGGCFVPADADPKGMLFLTRAPMWLQGLAESGFDPTRSSGIAKRVATSSATTPVAVNANIKNNRDGMNKVDMLQSMAEVFNAYAHSIYVYEMLRGRVGELSGKLRFDIAPGSTVKIEGTGEPFLRDDQLGEDIYASVIRVTIGINAEAAKAGTAFTLAFHRNTEENNSDTTSVDKHPLFTTKFLGAPLLKELEFGSCCE